MYIFIDTNIFFDNWYLRSPQFKLLSNFAANTDSCLLMPEVICQEIENKFNIGLKDAVNEAKKIARQSGNFCENRFEINLGQFPTSQYSFHDNLNSNFSNINFINYDAVQHSHLVTKAICHQRPFKGKVKGYRDALIWLSLINHIKDSDMKEDIIFITNNSDDFFSINDTEYSLHKDLQSDLNTYNITNNFILHTSLKSFIESNIKEDIHNFKHDDLEVIDEKFGELFEEYTETDSEYYMNDLSRLEFIKLLEDSDFKDAELLRLVSEFSFDVWEGMEDPEILNCSNISENELYIEYSYNLRRCTIELRFSPFDYYSNKDKLEKEFFNTEFHEDEVIMYAYTRCYFYANFIFNISEESITQFTVDNVFVK